jgi:hypothetical protein
MHFTDFENLAKYAVNTLCLCREVKRNGVKEWFVGQVTQPKSYGVPWPDNAKFGVLALNPENKDSLKVFPIIRARDWEFKSPPSGYIPLSSHASIYLERVPKRMWKVGLCRQNTEPNKFFVEWELPHVIRAVDRLHTKNFYYATIEEASQVANTKKTGYLAISPRYAVDNRFLYFRNRPIGEINRKNGTILALENPELTRLHSKVLDSKLGGYYFVTKDVLNSGKEDLLQKLGDYKYDFDV